jgi:hypothetical protein
VRSQVPGSRAVAGLLVLRVLPDQTAGVAATWPVGHRAGFEKVHDGIEYVLLIVVGRAIGIACGCDGTVGWWI